MNQGFDSPRGYQITRTRDAIAPGSLVSAGRPPDYHRGRQPPPLDGLQVPLPVEKGEKSFSTFSDLQMGQITF
jgi:hypothetical protein